MLRLWVIDHPSSVESISTPPIRGSRIVRPETNRPATNFPGISVDPNQFDCLDEKSGLRCLASTITKAYEIRPILISRCSAGVARVVRGDEAGGSNTLTPTINLLNSYNRWPYMPILWLNLTASLLISRSQQKAPSKLDGTFCCLISR